MNLNPRLENRANPSAASDIASDPLPPIFGKPRNLGWAAVVLLVATLLVFGDLLFGGGDRILSKSNTDLFTVFVGWSDFTFGEMARGNLPLWNPHLYSGAPCLGGFQEALLYPPSWLHLFLPMAQAFNWGIALHVFLAGIFTYMWMARRGIHPAAAIVSGLVFMFGGGYFMHILPGHLPNLRTMVWVPLIFLAIDDLTTTRSLRGAWIGAGAVAMAILAGHVQYVYFTAVGCAVYTLLCLWKSPYRAGAIVGLTLMGVGGAALSAAQLLTGLAATTESARAALSYDFASTFPFPPENLVTLAFSKFFGSSAPLVSNYWGRWLIWEDSLFIGIAACVLVVIGIVRGAPTHKRFALTMIVVSLLLAFGCYTPIYPFLFHHFPGISSFRGMSKFAFLAALFLANLAGAGFDRLIRESPMPRCPLKSLGAAAILIFFAGLFIWVSGNSGGSGLWGRFLTRIDWTGIGYRVGNHFNPIANGNVVRGVAHQAAGDFFIAAVVLALFIGAWMWAARFRWAILGIGGLVLAELLIFAWQNRPTFALADAMQMKQAVGQIQDYIKPGQRVITPQPTLLMMAGGDEAWGNDPVVLKRYVEAMAYGQKTPPDELFQRPYPYFTDAGENWGLLRIGAIIVPRGIKRLESPSSPRAQLIDRARVIADPKTLLQTLGSGHFPYATEVLLEQPVNPMPTNDPELLDSRGKVELKDLSSDEIEFTVTTPRPAILLVTDNYASGWRARSLDSNPPQDYQVVRADYTLRGVPLVAGRHHFVMEYRPTAYVIGKWITIGSLLIYIMLGVILWVPFATRNDAPASGTVSEG